MTVGLAKPGSGKHIEMAYAVLENDVQGNR